jgi:hypothetical protein
MADIYTPPPGALLRIKHPSTGKYLVAPVDAWGMVKPEWTDIWDAAAVFTDKGADDQVNRLAWHPHRLACRKTEEHPAPRLRFYVVVRGEANAQALFDVLAHCRSPRWVQKKGGWHRVSFAAKDLADAQGFLHDVFPGMLAGSVHQLNTGG